MNKSTLIVLLSFLAIYIGWRTYPDHFDKGLAAIPFTPQNTRQTGEIQKQRGRIAQIESQLAQATAVATNIYGDVTAIHKSLDPRDSAAVARFNSKSIAYQKVNERVKVITRELNAEKQKLGDMLAGTSPVAGQATATMPVTMPVAKPIQTPATLRKRVILYTTSSCPLCVKAKNYLVKKGIFYSEINVDSSRAAHAEFKKLGGNGVPLILVGDTRIQGFNEQEIDKALQ